MRQSISSIRSKQQGVVLLEALIAVVIFSMGILALVGLQAAMLQNTTGSKYRADASYIAQQRIGQMWSNPANATNYTEANTNISNLLPNGLRTVTQPVAGQFQLVVGWTAPNETAPTAVAAPCFMLAAHCFITTASITGG